MPNGKALLSDTATGVNRFVVGGHGIETGLPVYDGRLVTRPPQVRIRNTKIGEI